MKAKQGYSLACIGEAMVEIALIKGNASNAQIGFGGDSLNTAIYMARLCANDPIHIHYATLLGDDDFAQNMCKNWHKEGVILTHTARLQNRTTGLYAITTDEDGERHFTYWRDNAPARDLFDGADGLKRLETLQDMDGLFFSGISLAILKNEGRGRLLSLAKSFKEQGKEVFFDTNFRPRLWQGYDHLAIYKQAIQTATMLLPSSEELPLIYGKDLSINGWQDELAQTGCNEIILKNGGHDMSVYKDTHWQTFKLAKLASVLDTTAAGDSFNAGYIAARLKGKTIAKSVHCAHKLASLVIQYQGAIIAKDKMSGIINQ